MDLKYVNQTHLITSPARLNGSRAKGPKPPKPLPFLPPSSSPPTLNYFGALPFERGPIIHGFFPD